MTEALSYVLRVALTGTGIVFLFLAALSLIMSAIRGIDGLLAPGQAAEPVPPAAAPQRSSALPAWAVAAVAAYLDAETESREISAAVWVRRDAR